MAWTKMKIAIAVGAGILLAAITTITVKEIQNHKVYPWQIPNFNSSVLDKVEPQVRIVPAKHDGFGGSGNSNGKFMGLGVTVKTILQTAYQTDPARMKFPANLSENKYDFIANLPSGNANAMQQEIKRKFNLTAKRENQATDVLILTAKHPNAAGLKTSMAREGSSRSGPGRFSCKNQPLSNLAGFLEGYFVIPVIDQTGLHDRFDLDLTWDEDDLQHHNPDALKQILFDQLGLELVPSVETIEMLIVERVKD